MRLPAALAVLLLLAPPALAGRDAAVLAAARTVIAPRLDALAAATGRQARAENAVATGEGVIGLYDAADGYRRVGEMPSHGIGPHDLAFVPNDGALGPELIVANGGIRTHPATGREILNPEAMEPSLAVLDPASGAARLRIDLGPHLRGLSIRHLAVTPAGEVVFGCQFEGDDMPPLVGVLGRDGRTRFLDMPEDDLAAMQGYVGEVGLDASGRIAAATSPRGGVVALFDLASGRYLGRRRMADVCGVAPAPEGAETFLVTSGNAGVRLARPDRAELAWLGGSDLDRWRLDRWSWDNHLVRLQGLRPDAAPPGARGTRSSGRSARAAP